MAKTWYPVIDYLTCLDCGTCVAKCSHDVYDSTKEPSPVVRNPQSCIDHCHGCGNLCPVGAITYVGEDTGWTPPTLEQKERKSCCSCGCDESLQNIVHVDYLYLDLETCDRCIGTDSVLDEVITTLAPALRLAGYKIGYHKIKIETKERAERYQFSSSPTIRINGHDICGAVKENSCGCCSEISGADVDCRVFEYKGETYEVPPKEMLAKSILTIVFNQNESTCSCVDYKLPENLKNFFEGKENVKCACGGNCC